MVARRAWVSSSSLPEKAGEGEQGEGREQDHCHGGPHEPFAGLRHLHAAILSPRTALSTLLVSLDGAFPAPLHSCRDGEAKGRSRPGRPVGSRALLPRSLAAVADAPRGGRRRGACPRPLLAGTGNLLVPAGMLLYVVFPNRYAGPAGPPVSWQGAVRVLLHPARRVRGSLSAAGGPRCRASARGSFPPWLPRWGVPPPTRRFSSFSCWRRVPRGRPARGRLPQEACPGRE